MSLPPRGRGTALAVEGARETLQVSRAVALRVLPHPTSVGSPLREGALEKTASSFADLSAVLTCELPSQSPYGDSSP